LALRAKRPGGNDAIIADVPILNVGPRIGPGSSGHATHHVDR
jgi:hypothetical protein